MIVPFSYAAPRFIVIPLRAPNVQSLTLAGRPPELPRLNKSGKEIPLAFWTIDTTTKDSAYFGKNHKIDDANGEHMNLSRGSSGGGKIGLADRSGPMSGSWGNTLLLIGLLALAYLGLGQFAFSMAVRNANITCQAFFPEGVSLVCIILFGPRVAPGIFLGQFVLAQWTGLSPGTSALIGLSNSLEGILGGWLFWRWRISPSLNRPREVAKLFTLCALILQPLSATGGIAAQYLLSGLPVEKIPSVWLYWWAGNTLGQLLVLPLILTWLSHPGALRRTGEIRHALTVVFLYYIPVAVFVFGDWGEHGPLYRLMVFAAFYLPLVWVAVQSRVQTVALTNLLLTAPFLCLINAGPDLAQFFSNQNFHLSADILIMAGIVTSLLLSALWEQLNERSRQLHDANVAREKLFAVIGHDLNAPLASLKTTLDMLADGSLSREEFREFQEDLRRGVDHALQAVKNLMEWGSHQLSTSQPRPADVPLRACADEAVKLLALASEAKRLSLENRIPPEAVIRADPHQILSVLRNLISNAIKFTPAGGTILLSAVKTGKSWQTSVQDNGVGMPPDRAAGLFNSSSEYRSTPGTDNERGLGLGLQLCQEFILANHGTIHVESLKGSGTTFRFILPSATA
jgi:signal transduction histidine kinase